jgi:hypothetical protein
MAEDDFSEAVTDDSLVSQDQRDKAPAIRIKNVCLKTWFEDISVSNLS